ncbi:hypothetical protein PMI42_05898 [Bradyrhizobium sp. YR681]|uniref:hypothetical protein n=1 Tax=Bradyrhizobium sp. YR681 TaxID=1144344 RepID=UPI00026F6B9F|nr:hypothetical protein [Bradyrhizobium sp. YR681]EJN10788.1 hypothetical protein PMI42_05898 [Bradyrhizobium sp. YR681]
MLPLDHPLWKRLDDAHRDRDIPQLLARLSEAWDDDSANSLFWDCLCHQGTCYGATYAAIPHLLTIARVDANRHQRLEIALFCGYVVLNALMPREQGDDQELSGLPRTAEEWDQKLDCFRSLVAQLEDPSRRPSHHELARSLPRYRRILLAGPVVVADLGTIDEIRQEFLSLLSTVSKTCEQALLEKPERESAVMPLLGGIAAAEGHRDLGNLFFQGQEGWLKCTGCGLGHQFALLGDQVALYAEQRSSIPAAGMDRRPLLDMKEGTPSRSDGIMMPVDENRKLAPSIVRLIRLADRVQPRPAAMLLRNFLGSFHCRRCDAEVPVCAG